MSGSRRGTAVDVDVHAEAGVGGRLARRAGEPGAAEVLDADDEAGVEQLEAGLDEALLLVRVADLDARPLGGVRPGPSPRRRSRPRRARSPRRCRPGPVCEPSSTARLPTPEASAEHEALDGQHAEAEDVHERIAPVALGRR